MENHGLGTLNDKMCAESLTGNTRKGPSINNVFSKLEIFDPFPPPLLSSLLSEVYVLNRLWGYPPPPTETT